MEKLELVAEVRDNKISAEDIRDQNKIPAEIYGRGFDNKSLSVDYLTFEKALAKAGESTLVDLNVGSEGFKVLIHDVQYHPVTDKILHVDFRRVRLDEKVKAEVPIKLLGEAPAVKEYGGIVNEALEFVEIEAFPADLIYEIEIDISGMSQLGDKIYVKDIKLPETITIITTPDVLIAGMDEPNLKEEKPTTEESADSTEVVNDKKGDDKADAVSEKKDKK